jgi:iron complex outermembrane receptor protein
MKHIQLLSAVLLLILITPSPVIAQSSASPESSRERALEERVQELEQELEVANETIADLQNELKNSSSSDGAVAGVAGASPGADADVAPLPIGTALRVSRQNDTQSPASVSNVGWKDLMLGGVEDVSRLQYLVPGLRYGQTGHDVRLAMRGARSNSVGPETSNVVAMYEDGVYVATSTEGLWSFMDVERIDVLRGPQITNFGQHAYAGAVSVVSNKPSFDGFGVYAEMENALPDKTRWRLTLNAPATDTLAFRIAGVSESRSGWIDNRYLDSDSDDLKDRKVQSIRVSILWQPKDELSLLFWSRYHDENGTGSGPWGYQQIGAYINGQLKPSNHLVGPGYTPDEGPWIVHRNFISATSYENWVNTLDLNWDMGFANLQWLFNFTSFHGKQIYDNDYSDKGLPRTSAFSGWKTDQSGWSNELRLTSNSGGSLNWLLGLYWSDRNAKWGWLESYQDVSSQPDWDVHGTYSTDTQALFGQVSYDFNERWGITGGLRWNDQGKEMKSGEKDSWDDVLWKAALQYSFSDRSMTYLSASTGYRAGGINTATGVDPIWEPEKLTAYELGLKTTLADGKVQMNLAGWFNDFKDVQSQSFLVQPYPGSPEATEYTGNGGSMDARGLEAEIQWMPMRQWRIATQIAYTDAKFGNYTAANLAGLGEIPGHTEGDTLQYRGWRPAISPEWVVGLQTSYTIQLKSAGTLTPYLQTSYSSDYYANDINLAGVRQGSHTRTDFRIIWASPLEHFELQFYYLNGEDEAQLNWARVYNPASRPEITTLQADWTNPNTYGIIFNLSF